MHKKLIVGVLIAAGLSGCSGKIVNYTDAEKACASGKCNGILYYPLTYQTERFYYDRILGKDNAIVRFSGGQAKDGSDKCTPLIVTETKLVPSPKPSLIDYEPGLLETVTFGVELTSSGTISKVNTDSTPGAKTAADTFATNATAVKTLKADANILSGGGTKPVNPENLLHDRIPLCSAGRVPLGTDQALGNGQEPPKDAAASNGCRWSGFHYVCDK